MSGVSRHRYRSPAEWSHLSQSSTSGERCVSRVLYSVLSMSRTKAANSLVESRIQRASFTNGRFDSKTCNFSLTLCSCEATT